MKKHLWLVVLILLSGCSPSIEYGLDACSENPSIKYLGNGFVNVRNNDEYRISYSSLSVKYGAGYDPAQLTVFNKSNEIITIRRVTFFHDYGGGNLELTKTKESNITIEAASSNDVFFYPQHSFGFVSKGSINDIYDQFNNVDEIDVVVNIDMMVGALPVTVNERFKVCQSKSYF